MTESGNDIFGFSIELDSWRIIVMTCEWVLRTYAESTIGIGPIRINITIDSNEWNVFLSGCYFQ